MLACFQSLVTLSEAKHPYCTHEVGVHRALSPRVVPRCWLFIRHPNTPVVLSKAKNLLFLFSPMLLRTHEKAGPSLRSG
jgi:hypothetical protein